MAELPKSLKLAAILSTMVLAGCEMDTTLHTTVAVDGSVVRKIGMRLKGVERRAEAKTYPQKTFNLPSSPVWNLTENAGGQISATVKVAPGKPIPGGYQRQLKALDRTSGNSVSLKVRDHYFSTSYLYEETFSDTVKAEEFKEELLKQYDRVAAQNLTAVETEFGRTHDLGPARKYIKKDLRKLFVSTADAVERSGLFSAMATMIFRLAFGGFPIKNLQQLFDADPREATRALFELGLRRIRLRPDRMLNIDEKAFQKHLEALTGGTVDQQQDAQKALVGMGPMVLRRLDNAFRAEKARNPKSGASTRLSATAEKIREGLKKRMDALLDKLVKDTETYYLHPPPEKKEEIEQKLARYLGAHIEASFAPMEYFFLCRVSLPGELAWVDRQGRKMTDGSVRWNFSAVNFFIRDKVCRARSRVWNHNRIKGLGQALLKDPAAMTLKMREQLDDLFSELNAKDLKAIRDVLTSSVTKKSRQPLEDLAKDPTASKPAMACATKILKILSTSASALP